MYSQTLYFLFLCFDSIIIAFFVILGAHRTGRKFAFNLLKWRVIKFILRAFVSMMKYSKVRSKCIDFYTQFRVFSFGGSTH